ncbi:hypothetical protein NM688_g1511 [Phlebia brevispora]|uniref:Uncharacterized protein n=1 Tax=Phlebia brevispora TaxID=194682 RepID=A0ACC1TB32_9APHY|nr:hypothetical protein NM688_g1511 [Phlebia brevispora]
MSVFYPDNPNRADRVQQLVTQIHAIQNNVLTYVNGIKANCDRAVQYLDSIAKHAGHQTVDEYLQAAMAELPQNERENFEKLKQDLQSHDGFFDAATKVAGALMCIASVVGTGRSAVSITVKLYRTHMLQLTVLAFVRGTALIFTGSVDSGMTLVRSAFGVAKDAQKVEGIGGTLGKTLRGLKRFSEVIGVLGPTIDALALTADAYVGSQQKEQLQNAIVELCCRRFSVKKLEQQAFLIQLSYGDAKAILSDYEGFLKDIENEKVTTQYVNQKMEEKLSKAADEVKKMMQDSDRLSDQKIWSDLAAMDRASSIAWTVEDPDLAQILPRLEKIGIKSAILTEREGGETSRLARVGTVPVPVLYVRVGTNIRNRAASESVCAAKLALNYKGLPYRTVWLEYPEIEPTCIKLGVSPTGTKPDGSPFYTCPIIYDPTTKRYVSDSLIIAQYLDETYPETPQLVRKGTAPLHLALEDAFLTIIGPSLFQLVLYESWVLLNEASKPYYKMTREAFVGTKLEDLAPPGPKRDEAWKQAEASFGSLLKWVEANGKDSDLLGGDSICQSDFIVGAYLIAAQRTLGEDSEEWSKVMGWHGGKWKRFMKWLEPYVDESM